jgi:hypothetical protein
MAEEKKTNRQYDDDDFSPEAVNARWEKFKAEHNGLMCLHCANLLWPKRTWGVNHKDGSTVLYPICAHHADSPGEAREVHPGECCANYRAKPKPAVHGQPPQSRKPGERYIPLTRGLWAIVDEADYERLSRYHWIASPSGGGKIYARRNTKTGTILMHREIMNAPPGMCVDHKDRNTLNNHQDNLRVCRPDQNEHNKAPRGRKSRFKGVYPRGDRWYAMLKHKGKLYYLGTFANEIEAAKARDRKAYELEGEFAYLNFPDEIPGGIIGPGPSMRR